MFAKYHQASRDECAQRYPVKEKLIVTTKYLPGRVDTLPGMVIDCDSVVRSLSSTPSKLKAFSAVVKCPPSFKVVDTVYTDTSSVKEDTRVIEHLSERLLQSQLSEEAVKTDNKRLKKSNTTLSWTVGIESLGLIVLLYFLLRSKFKLF